jgi:hypothetical protein
MAEFDDHYEPLVGEKKTNSASYKKYAAGLGVTGVTVAAALLMAGGGGSGSKAPSGQAELIELPEQYANMTPTELYGDSETCMTSFNRIWADNGNSIESPEFH